MRTALPSKAVLEHLALAYTSWAWVADDGKVPDRVRADWLKTLARQPISPDYRSGYERWRESFQPPNHVTFQLTLVSRLLVGHGNSSATDVGLTVHHTWGVPVVPGTALKGLLAHCVDAVYGPSNPDIPPWEQQGEQQEHAEYQGVIRKQRRIRRGPGKIYRVLFGAPDADEDDLAQEKGWPAGASAGRVIFHDALYVPGRAPDARPFAVDVLTVHQRHYYSGDPQNRPWPNDYDAPIPVGFLTVRPGIKMLFALSGPEDWVALAKQLLRDALRE